MPTLIHFLHSSHSDPKTEIRSRLLLTNIPPKAFHCSKPKIQPPQCGLSGPGDALASCWATQVHSCIRTIGLFVPSAPWAEPCLPSTHRRAQGLSADPSCLSGLSLNAASLKPSRTTGEQMVGVPARSLSPDHRVHLPATVGLAAYGSHPHPSPEECPWLQGAASPEVPGRSSPPCGQ